MNDDIEILDIFNEKKEVKKIDNEIKNEPPKKAVVEEVKPKKKKRKAKVKAWQILFCSLSFLFLLSCCIYYGSRFIKYYRIYNPKVDTKSGETILANSIKGNSEVVYDGSGLYISAGDYIYKGDVKNNYLKFNNMLWRIVRINVDQTIEIILDDYINLLPWNKESVEFKKSEVFKYLNNDFLNNLSQDLLIKNNFCEDKISDLTSITCNNQNNESYVKLLDVVSYLNTVKDKKTYLASSDEIFWLNDYNDEKVWHTNGANVSTSDANKLYEIRPMLKLKSTAIYKNGDGTKDKPYEIIEESKLGLGSRVLLGDDEWIVYEVSDVVKLMRKDTLSSERSFAKDSLIYDPLVKDSLAEYLNTTYLESLSYKNMLVNSDWYIGKYEDDLANIKGEKVTAKVGIPSLLDIKFDSTVNGYYTLTNNGETIYVYENPLRPSRSTSLRKIRPCIAISKGDANKLKEDNGIFKVGE